MFVMINCMINWSLEHPEGRGSRLRTFHFWGFPSVQEHWKSLRFFFVGWVNWVFGRDWDILQVYLTSDWCLFLITLILWLNSSLDNFGRNVFFNLTIKALSQWKRAHDPRIATCIISIAAWMCTIRRRSTRTSSWGYLFLLGSVVLGNLNCVIVFIDLWLM